MKSLLPILLSLLLVVTTLSLDTQTRKEKKARKKEVVEQPETPANRRTPTEERKMDNTDRTIREVKPVEKSPVVKEVDSKDRRERTIIDGKPSLTIEDVVKKAKPVVERKQTGNIDWTEQYVEAKGMSVLDNERFKNPAQARAMAIRGAVVVAQRNLLELIEGVNVTSETTVKDMITQTDYIYTRIDGVIKGAEQVGEPIEKDGMIEVTMRVPIYSDKGFAPVIYEQMSTEPGRKIQMASGITEVLDYEDIGGAEGIVFNFNGKQIDPTMFPVVVDDNGNVLFDFYSLYDPKTGKFPKILQQSKELFEELGYEKGLSIIDVAETFNGKIQLDKINAGKINWDKLGKLAGSAGKILKFALALI